MKRELLYSTVNYTQYLVIISNRKNLKKKVHIYIYIYNHFDVHLKAAHHCKPTIPQFKKRKNKARGKRCPEH